MPKPDVIAREVRAARDEAGLSQEALARACGCSIGTVQKIEQGLTDNPTAMTLMAIARACKTTVGRLLGESRASKL